MRKNKIVFIKNSFFKYSLILIFASFISYMVSKYMNDNSQTLFEWEFGVYCSFITTLINLLYGIVLIILKFRRKIN